MSFPTGLFVDAPEMQDASMHAMSEDVESWPEELVQKMKERIPQSATMSIIVKFMKKDDENGTATGSLLVSNNAKQAVVPVIIKDFMMYPLDVFISDNKLLPLNPNYFQAIFMDNSAFQKMEEYPTYAGMGRFEEGNLWNATYPPSLGRYAYASAGYDVLDAISDTIDPKEFREFLVTNPTVAMGFQKRGHAELIKKVANLRPVNMNEFRQGKDNLIKRDIHMLRKDGPNKYTILSNSDKVFSPALTVMNREECMGFVSKVSDCAQDDINDVDQNGEKLLVVPERSQDELYFPEGHESAAEMANEYDHYVVRKKNGVEVEGVVIPKVIDFDMNLTALKMFLGKTMSTIQTEIAGVRVQNSSFQPAFEDPRVGQTGAFVFQMNKSKGLATVPVTIKSVSQDPCGETLMKVMDLQGHTFKVKITSAELERIALIGDCYSLPKGFKWAPMQGFEEVSNSTFDYAAKTAAAKLTPNPVLIASTGYSQYSMKGAEKYAQEMKWDPTMLETYQVKFLLASMGMGSEKISETIKQASFQERVSIHGLNRPMLKSEKIAAAVPKARKLSSACQAIKSNLTKEASYVENSQTVDALLSLNFVNPENISKFVGKIAMFKAAISNLASLLIASRIGVKEIPEQAVATAMTRLVDVVNGLEGLRATQEA